MKKLVLLAILLFAGWKGWQHFHPEAAATALPEQGFATSPSTMETREPTQRFECDGRQYCSQMTSREEAEFFVRHCPGTKMDGDHDGEPCERDTRF